MLLLHSVLLQLTSLTALCSATNQLLYAMVSERPQNGCISVIFTEFIRPTIGNAHAIQVNLGRKNDAPLQSAILELLHTSNCPTQVMSIWTQLPMPNSRKNSFPLRKIKVFIMFVSSIADVDEILRNWRTMTNWHPNVRVILVIDAVEQPNCAVRRMLELFLAYGMQHVFVVYDAPNINRLAVITWEPVGGDVSVQAIRVCEYDRISDKEGWNSAKLKFSTYVIRED